MTSTPGRAGPVTPRGTGRVVVLGATGSVGRQVCAGMQGAGWEVHGLARRPAVDPIAGRFRPVDLTAADPDRLARLIDDTGASAVVNAAGGWGDTDDEMRYSHLDLIENLLPALARTRNRPRLVHLGSVHEYGPVPEGRPIDEEIEPSPVTPYAQTKLRVSERVLAAVASGGVDAVVLRAVNMIGPHPPAESFPAALVRRLHAAWRDGTDLELDLADARRDFVDVRDVSRAVRAAACAGRVSAVLNIGSGRAVPVRELVDGLVAAAGFPAGRVVLRRGEVRSKGGDWTRMDIRRAARELGWSPRIGLADSLRATWQSSLRA